MIYGYHSVHTSFEYNFEALGITVSIRDETEGHRVGLTNVGGQWWTCAESYVALRG